jgi:nicotinamidase-related amidase
MLLKQHRIAKVIVIGLLANTCIETTGRFAMELGYHFTLVKDATAAFNKDRVHAGDELNGQHTRTRFFTTVEVLAALPQGRHHAATASTGLAFDLVDGILPITTKFGLRR